MKTKRFLKCFAGLAAVSLLSPLAAEPEKEAEPPVRSVTVIDHQDNFRDAWVGYSDGTVQYCLGGGESAGPTWASCAEAGNIPNVAVTAIAARPGLAFPTALFIDAKEELTCRFPGPVATKLLY